MPATVTPGNVIPAVNLDYLWNTLVTPRLGSATNAADSYSWGGSFDPNNIQQGTDCSGAVSAENSAIMRGPGCIYGRQFYTGTFMGITPGQRGPFAGIDDTRLWVCIASPADAPPDAVAIIAVRNMADPTDSHMIMQVQGTTIEMGGNEFLPNGIEADYHTNPPDGNCSRIDDTSEFNQWFYIDAVAEGGSVAPATPSEPSDTLWADVSEFQNQVDDSYLGNTYTAGNGVSGPPKFLSIRSNDGTYQDHKFDANHRWCLANTADKNPNGLYGFFVYCYWRPGWQQDLATMQAEVEADGGPSPYMVAMIDVETGGNPNTDASADLNAFYTALVQWLGGDARRVIAYANVGDEKALWQMQPNGLEWILAGYGSNPTPPVGTFKLAHQYTDGSGFGGGLPEGFAPFGTCDMNSADGYTPTALAAKLGLPAPPGTSGGGGDGSGGGLDMASISDADAAVVVAASRKILAMWDNEDLTQPHTWPSRSMFATSGAGVDDTTGMLLNTDANAWNLMVIMGYLIGNPDDIAVVEACAAGNFPQDSYVANNEWLANRCQQFANQLIAFRAAMWESLIATNPASKTQPPSGGSGQQ